MQGRASVGALKGAYFLRQTNALMIFLRDSCFFFRKGNKRSTESRSVVRPTNTLRTFFVIKGDVWSKCKFFIKKHKTT